LQQAGDIDARSAKRIIIPIIFKSRLEWNPRNCKLIEPTEKEELNDSTIYDLMKIFLLKS
jgi:hypothetical protein